MLIKVCSQQSAKTLHWEENALRFQLDRSMMLETGGDIDKYLIHDSWGHIWQGYLSDLTEHYDRLATMQFPINADYHVALPDDNIVCLADCLYLHQDGSVSYDESLARDYIHAVINERMSALLTPICAELCADIIEYSFHADHLDTDIDATLLIAVQTPRGQTRFCLGRHAVFCQSPGPPHSPLSKRR